LKAFVTQAKIDLEIKKNQDEKHQNKRPAEINNGLIFCLEHILFWKSKHKSKRMELSFS